MDAKLKRHKDAMAEELALVGKQIGVDMQLASYESQMGYPATVSNVDKARQWSNAKCRLGATAVMDECLREASMGFAIYGHFLHNVGGQWAYRQPAGIGGMINPEWQGLQRVAEQFGPLRFADPLEIRIDRQNVEGVDCRKIGVYYAVSLDDPSTRLLAILNRNLDLSAFPSFHPDHDPDVTGAAKIVICTSWKSVAAVTAIRNIGPMLEHNLAPVGQMYDYVNRIFYSDPLSTGVTIDAVPVAPPVNAGRIELDGVLGVPAGGLRGGNFVVLKLEGVA